MNFIPTGTVPYGTVTVQVGNLVTIAHDAQCFSSAFFGISSSGIYLKKKQQELLYQLSFQRTSPALVKTCMMSLLSQLTLFNSVYLKLKNVDVYMDLEYIFLVLPNNF